jgi:hypothetical protein
VLKPPEGLRIEVMRGDRVWGVVRDELGVSYVVRMRVQG